MIESINGRIYQNGKFIGYKLPNMNIIEFTVTCMLDRYDLTRILEIVQFQEESAHSEQREEVENE